MKIAVVKGSTSKLAGSRCRHCPHPIQPGQTVLYQTITEIAYGENRFVVHADCIAALLARAPQGLPAGSAEARFHRTRQAIINTGNPYVDLEAS